jgi:uncharacterized repeat protein (TIGR03803 family)
MTRNLGESLYETPTVEAESFHEPRRPSRQAIWIFVLLCGSLLAASAAAQTFGLVHRFGANGEARSSLVHAMDGFFYGTTYGDGSSGVGSAFRVDAAGNFTTIHSFQYPEGAHLFGALIQATDLSFYGVASQGGSHDLGTIFRMEPSGNVTVLHNFDGDGSSPESALVQALDGNFYGTTTAGGAYGQGTAFRMDSAGNFTTLHNFTSSEGTPFAPLIQGSDGNFYGTTFRGGSAVLGSIFEMDATGAVTTLYSFAGSNGEYPSAALLQASDGDFYGTTQFGGINGYGTVFRMSPSGTVVSLVSFTGSDIVNPFAPLIEGQDGYFYGTGVDGIFQMDSSGTVTPIHVLSGDDGDPIYAGLVEGAEGNFYGTTFGGGANGSGTVFEVDTAGTLSTLHAFSGPAGNQPRSAPLAASDGNYYGTTTTGGAYGDGTAFRLDPFGNLTTIHSFDGTDGASPLALIEASDGFFYGTTVGGGANGSGTVFRMNSSGDVTTIHSFNGIQGAAPHAGLVEASDGYFYGTTQQGGTKGWGTVFRIDTSGAIHILFNFDINDTVNGYEPWGGLIQATNGKFYGTTYSGGANQAGTIFHIDSAGVLTTLHSFDFTTGFDPNVALLQASDGNFYGSAGQSVIFKMDLSGTVTPFHVLTQDEGAYPGPLIQGTDGNLYGSAFGNNPNHGAVFRIDLLGNFTTLHSFDGADGDQPSGGLLQAADGSFYGTTIYGGNPDFLGDGVIFRLTAASPALNAGAPRSGSAAGGTLLELLGGGFLDGATFTVGGVAASGVVVLDETWLYGSTPALSPGTLNDVVLANPGGAPGAATTLPHAFFADFLDVPQLNIFHDFVETIFRNGVTAGCGGGNYCPTSAVTRGQMAVFLLKSEHGSSYVPPTCTGIFPDVPCPSTLADWIEQLFVEGVTAGCGGGLYCPDSPVTRRQMAAFLLKAKEGSSYTPPAATGIFEDVPLTDTFAPWIEDLYNRKVTGGCQASPLLYCPDNSNTRGQMAVFLVKMFELPR